MKGKTKMETSQVRYVYIRDRRNNPIGVVGFQIVETSVSKSGKAVIFDYSLCNLKAGDTFSKDMGKRIVLGRLSKDPRGWFEFSTGEKLAEQVLKAFENEKSFYEDSNESGNLPRSLQRFLVSHKNSIPSVQGAVGV